MDDPALDPEKQKRNLKPFISFPSIVQVWWLPRPPSFHRPSQWRCFGNESVTVTTWAKKGFVTTWYTKWFNEPLKIMLHLEYITFDRKILRGHELVRSAATVMRLSGVTWIMRHDTQNGHVIYCKLVSKKMMVV